MLKSKFLKTKIILLQIIFYNPEFLKKVCMHRSFYQTYINAILFLSLSLYEVNKNNIFHSLEQEMKKMA